jgi:hypothetical protein
LDPGNVAPFQIAKKRLAIELGRLRYPIAFRDLVLGNDQERWRAGTCRSGKVRLLDFAEASITHGFEGQFSFLDGTRI